MKCVVLLFVFALSAEAQFPPMGGGMPPVAGVPGGGGGGGASSDLGSFSAGGVGCSSLISTMCQPCPQGGDEKFCRDIARECKNLFCNPICLRLTWTVRTKVASCQGKDGIDCSRFRSEVSTKKYQKALAAEFKAYGCSDMLSCCDRDNRLLDWIDNSLYGKDFPFPRLPIPSCSHNSSDIELSQQVCSKCKGALAIEVEGLQCPDFSPQKAGGIKPKQSDETAFLDLSKAQVRRSHSSSTMRATEKLRLLNLLYGRAMEAPTPGPFLAGNPAFRSFPDRCTAFALAVQRDVAKLQEKFAQHACGCLGCCDDPADECFFPALINIP